MKKFFLLLAFMATVSAVQAQGQPDGGDPAAFKQRYVERTKPDLIKAAKLTEAQADKVLDIQFSYMGKMREMRNLDQAQREEAMKGIQAAQNKEMTAIPLTEEQIKAVNTFFEERRKNRPQGGQGGGN